MRTVRLAFAVGVIAAAVPGARGVAHEVTHEIVYGRAVAVRARYAGAAPLANAEYQIFSPADPKTPWQRGRTDREGWVSFVPGESGTWRVQVADGTGHGMILSVTARPPTRARDAGEGTLAWILRLVAAGGAVLAATLAFAALRRLRARAGPGAPAAR